MKFIILVFLPLLLLLGCTGEDKVLEEMLADENCVVTDNDELICTTPEGSSGKGEFKRVTINCNMRVKPTTSSAKVGKVRKGRRIYTEDAPVMGWYKIYRKKGVAYVSGICFVEDDSTRG